MSYEEPTPKEDYQIPGIMARGYAWPTFCKDWEARLDALAGFEPRDDDVFVISYPKSGHHWSHEFLSMIINEKTDMPQMTTGDGFLEYDTLEKLDENPSPRLILTALQFQFLPKRILEKGNKIIRITRNPKDVCVSYYNHTCAIKNYNYTAPLSHFVEIFLSGQNNYGSFFEYERRYKAELDKEEFRARVFHTSFETLKKDPMPVMKQLGGFLGLERSEDFYQRVVAQTSFDNVKAFRDAANAGK